MVVEGERRDDSLWGVIVKCDDICFTHDFTEIESERISNSCTSE